MGLSLASLHFSWSPSHSGEHHLAQYLRCVVGHVSELAQAGGAFVSIRGILEDIKHLSGVLGLAFRLHGDVVRQRL